MITSSKLSQSLVKLTGTTAVLLAIPFTGMQFSNEINWSVSDFIISGIMIFSTGLAYVLFTRKHADLIYKAACALSLFSSLLMVWSNLAVGLIGHESTPINLLYFGVLGLGIIGTFIAGFKPYAMARVLFIMATGVVGITVIALMFDMQELPGSSFTEVIGVNAFFITLFMISAGLFQFADRSDSQFKADKQA